MTDLTSVDGSDDLTHRLDEALAAEAEVQIDPFLAEATRRILDSTSW